MLSDGLPGFAPATVIVRGRDDVLVVRSWGGTGVTVSLGASALQPVTGSSIEVGWADDWGWVWATATVIAAETDRFRMSPPEITERLQRRDAVRVRCSWPVCVTTFADGRPRSRNAEVLDVSPTGIAVRISLDVPREARIGLMIFPPEHAPLSFVAEVVGFDHVQDRARLRLVGSADGAATELARLVAELARRLVR